MPHLASPPGIHLPLALIFSLQVQCNEWIWILLQRPQLVGVVFQSLWGCHDICPLLNQFHVTSITHLELSSLTSLWAWGDVEKFCSDIAFLLVLTEEGAVGHRVFGLSTMWVYPYQARGPTMEEAVKQLTPLPSTGSDCPYALVQLNRDACHAPLPREGHLSILVMGAPVVPPTEQSVNYRSTNSWAWVPR